MTNQHQRCRADPREEDHYTDHSWLIRENEEKPDQSSSIGNRIQTS